MQMVAALVERLVGKRVVVKAVTMGMEFQKRGELVPMHSAHIGLSACDYYHNNML